MLANGCMMKMWGMVAREERNSASDARCCRDGGAMLYLTVVGCALPLPLQLLAAEDFSFNQLTLFSPIIDAVEIVLSSTS